MTKLRMLAVLGLAVLMLVVAGCTGADEPAAEAPAEPAFAVGESVAAEWTDGHLYLAEVTAVADDGIVTVTYKDDDSSADLEESKVFAIEATEWEEGDRVLAVWAVARFYSGTIDEFDGTDYIVSWDDGSDPSIVRPTEIIAYDAAYADDAE